LIDFKKILFQAEVDVAKAERLADIEIAKAKSLSTTEMLKKSRESHEAQMQAAYAAFLEVAKEESKQNIPRAQFIQGAAAAIATTYTGILAYTFAVESSQPVPARGIIPTLLLGLAIALASAYVGLLSEPGQLRYTGVSQLPAQRQRERNLFITWVRAKSLRRVYCLHGAVVSLCLGACFLPFPYVQMQDNVATAFALVSVLVVSAIVLEGFRRQTNPNQTLGSSIETISSESPIPIQAEPGVVVATEQQH
jgi:hypothetical protein